MRGSSLALKFSVNASASNVLRIRQEFLTRAILRVKAMVARGEPEEVNTAMTELVRYFSWIEGSFSQEARERLSIEIQNLYDVAKNLENDLRVSEDTLWPKQKGRSGNRYS